MMDLSTLTKPPAKAPMITIVGTPGVGKTTLAALFPKPVFISAEDGSSVFDTWDEDAKPVFFPQLPRATDKVSTKDTVLEQLRALAREEHDFKTVVIDSVTSMNLLFEKEVCDVFKVSTVAEAAGGYQNGYNVVSEYHAQIKTACDYLVKAKGMTVIFLAHAGVKKMKNRPDAEEYTVYTLNMHDKSIVHYVDYVDAVLYLRQDEFIKGQATDKKGNITKYGKIVQSGDRVLVTSGDGRVGYVNAKNRYDLEPEIPVGKGENPLLDLIPYFVNQRG